MKHPPQSLTNAFPNRNLLVMKQVAIDLLRLATEDSLRLMGELFGVSESTVSKVVWRLVHALNARGDHLI